MIKYIKSVMDIFGLAIDSFYYIIKSNMKEILKHTALRKPQDKFLKA